MTITATSSAKRRIPKNKSEMTNLKKPSATSTNFYTRIQNQNLITNSRPTYTGSTTKSNIITNQIMSRRTEPQTNQIKIEVNRTITNTNYSQSRSHPRTPAPERSSSRNSRGDSRNKMNINEKYNTKTMTTYSSMKRRNNENLYTSFVTTTMTRVERRGGDNQNINTGKTSTNVSMRKRYKQK